MHYRTLIRLSRSGWPIKHDMKPLFRCIALLDGASAHPADCEQNIALLLSHTQTLSTAQFTLCGRSLGGLKGGGHGG
jgi:hypothetical protein